MSFARTETFSALAPFEIGSSSNVQASGLHVLAVYDGTVFGYFARVARFLALAVYEGEPNPNVLNTSLNKLYALAVYGIGAPEELTVRAFSFIMDGHKYYVLQLGELGTWIRDHTTQQWHQWGTVGYTRWNAKLGLNWDDRVLVADTVDNTIWEVDPDNWQDQGFKDIVHVTSAIIPNNTTNYMRLDEVNLSVSSGFMDSLNSRITLEYSDDRGVTYETPEDGVVSLTVGDYAEQISWQSLGSFTMPGRVIRITDVGGPLRIDWATARIDGVE